MTIRAKLYGEITCAPVEDMMQFEVAGLGNALVDALVQVDDDSILEELGLTKGTMHPVDHARWTEVYDRVKGHGVEIHPGGSCANTVATLAMLGSSSILCGQVGEDDFGRTYAGQMIDICGGHSIRFSPNGNTGKCLSIISTKDAERTLVTDLGAAVHLSGLKNFEERIRDSKLLHVTGYLFLGGPMAQVAWDAMDLAKELNIPISVDVADPFVVSAGRDEMWRALREYADIAFLNEEEAHALTGLRGNEAVEAVGEVVDIAIVKLGKLGSLIRTEGKTWRVGIHATEAVDTTGAGDTYAAGYLHGWLQGWDPQKAGDLGARLASLTVSQVGAVCRDGAEVSRILSAMETT